MASGEGSTLRNFILCTVHLIRMEEGRRAFKILMCIPAGKPRRKWGTNIRIDFKEIGVNTWNWIDSAQDGDYWRVLVNAALDLRIL